MGIKYPLALACCKQRQIASKLNKRFRKKLNWSRARRNWYYPTSYKGYTMMWEHGRQLAGMSKSGSTLSFDYDADGVRISKTVNGVETKYYTAGDQILRMEKGDDALDFLYDEAGAVFGVLHNGTPYYYVRNGQNDIVALVDQNANIIGQYSYDAWGKPIQVTGDAEIVSLNPFRYRGYVYDEETGLYYLQSRYYDPELGRFLNADAIAGEIGTLGSHNVFAYCMNNPVNQVDPSGHAGKKIIIGGVSIPLSTYNAYVAANCIFMLSFDYGIPWNAVYHVYLSSQEHRTNRRPNTGEPGSTWTAPNGDSRTFGDDRKPAHDYDHDDHGQPDKHPHDKNGGHSHDWDWSKSPPRGPAYVDWDTIAGIGLITFCVLGMVAVAADDASVIGIADNILYYPLGEGIRQGVVMIMR